MDQKLEIQNFFRNQFLVLTKLQRLTQSTRINNGFCNSPFIILNYRGFKYKSTPRILEIQCFKKRSILLRVFLGFPAKSICIEAKPIILRTYFNMKKSIISFFVTLSLVSISSNLFWHCQVP